MKRQIHRKAHSYSAQQLQLKSILVVPSGPVRRLNQFFSFLLLELDKVDVHFYIANSRLLHRRGESKPPKEFNGKLKNSNFTVWCFRYWTIHFCKMNYQTLKIKHFYVSEQFKISIIPKYVLSCLFYMSIYLPSYLPMLTKIYIKMLKSLPVSEEVKNNYLYSGWHSVLLNF